MAVRKTVEVVACPKCKGTILAPKRINRYSTMPHNLASEPMRIHFDSDFFLLECIECGQLLWPPIDASLQSPGTTALYDEMHKEITGNRVMEPIFVQKSTINVWDHIVGKR
jgi:uncharacterized protein YbaR (Trm112 family)